MSEIYVLAIVCHYYYYYYYYYYYGVKAAGA
jgi:hypothetical protein